MIREIETESGVLGINVIKKDEGDPGHVKIEYYRGKDVSVKVPGDIEGKPVTEIGKKAFLGAKTLVSIMLPESVGSIGDWAFASCSALKSIHIPGRELTLGSGLFRDCANLETIVTESGAGKENDEDLHYLLALSVYKMDAPYLFDIKKAGESDWIEHFDSVIVQILKRDDSDGFSKMLLCGEEDYVGDDSNLDTYVLLRKKEKIRILLVRLLHDRGLSEEYRKCFTDYLKENMYDALWPLILEEHGDEKEYFDLLIDVGCIDDSNVTELIDSMKDHYTQMKGYLIRFKKVSGGGDFFGDLDL